MDELNDLAKRLWAETQINQSDVLLEAKSGGFAFTPYKGEGRKKKGLYVARFGQTPGQIYGGLYAIIRNTLDGQPIPGSLSKYAEYIRRGLNE